jgi:hypothetical protein
MMARIIATAFIFSALIFPQSILAQEADSYKSFTKYGGLVPGVDFFASKKQLVLPYEKPVAELVDRLEHLFGTPLPQGSIFICSTLEQKDSIYEPMILKMGYAWTLSVESSDIRTQEMLEQMKSRMGNEIPAEMLDRMKSMQSSMVATEENRTVQETVSRMAYAVIQTSFAKNLKYRSTRLNDMGKSPLPDWMDIGIGVYATGEDPNLAYLKQNMEQTFPLEDILTMSRPFVASTFLQGTSSGGGSGSFGGRGGNSSGEGFPPGGFGGGGEGFPPGGFGGGGEGFPPGGFGGGGQGFPAGGFGGMSQGGGQGFPPGGFGGEGQNGGQRTSRGNGGQRGGPQRTIPKDEQDQMIFDGQSSTFFAFLLEKVGVEKVRELIHAVQNGTEGRDFIARPDMLGGDYGEIEKEWIDWVQNLQIEPESLRFDGPPGRKQN